MHTIERMAIIGAGNMGSGIAQKSAQEHFEVQMVDREQQWIDKGKQTISDFLDEAVGRRIFSPAQVEEIKDRITGVVGTENVESDTDLVIEAVFEDFSLKQEIFSSLDSTCDEKTILATNTSSLSVNELSQQVERKEVPNPGLVCPSLKSVAHCSRVPRPVALSSHLLWAGAKLRSHCITGLGMS